MRAFFIWLEAEEYIDKSPMKRIKVLPDLRKPKEYLEDDEVHALFSVLDRERYTEYRDFLIREIEIFVELLDSRPLLLESWDVFTWNVLLNKAIIHRNGDIEFVFRNKTTITISTKAEAT